MPNVYKRKSTRGNWSTESMVSAAGAVQEGKLNLYQASIRYGVPRNTLRDRVHGDTGKKPYAKPCVLGAENETALVDRIVYLQRLGFGLTISDVRRMAYDFVRKNNIKGSLFNNEKMIAGWGWYKSFMKRHPEIIVRQTQSISYARAECMNKPMVHTFFDMYEHEADKLNLRNSPQSIYNADETGLQLHLRPSKVLAAKGDKSVLQVTNSERGETVTVMACCNGAGNFIPPMVIFKGQRFKSEFKDGTPPGTVVEMSKSGYISAELFLSWLKHFQTFRTRGKAILVLDGHASHVKSLEVLDYARHNDITMICLPPHTTHYLQPLDRSFFKPLNVYYNQACKTFVSNHPGRSVTKLQFGSLLRQAWGKAATTENATNGFRICGICPVDRHSIPEYAYAPSAVSEIYPSSSASDQQLMSNIQLSADHEEVFSSATNPSLPAAQSPEAEFPTTSPTSQPTISTTPASITFRNLHPTPKIKRTLKVNDGRRQKAAVLTSDAYRKVLFDKDASKGVVKWPSLAKRIHRQKIDTLEADKGNDKQVNIGRQEKPKKQKKSRQKKKHKKLDVEDISDPSNYCAECGCSYFEPNQNEEEWIRCQMCERWFHETCADAVNDIYFTCRSCTNK